MRFRRNIGYGVLCLSLACSFSAYAADYDLVIKNGRVIDPETMLDAVLNVGIKDGMIVKITPDDIKGSKTIDASKHVVAPGFIDTHFHALDGLSLKLAALDGVTTGMDLEAGAIHVAKWYAEKDKGWPLNYGTGVSQEMTRMRVHDTEIDTSKPNDATTVFELRGKSMQDGTPGWSVSRSSKEQLNQILEYLDEEFRQGALGLSSTVGYMTQGVTTYEMFKSQEAAARYGRFTGAHVRFHGNPSNPEGPLGFSEIFANAIALDAPLNLNHNNEYGWWENEEKLQAAREQGYNVWSEYYPYTAASTAISAEFFHPDKFKVLSGGLPYEEVIFDPVQNKFLTQAEWEKTSKEHPDRSIFAFNRKRDEWLPFWLRMPHMIVASDAMWSGKGIDSWDLNPTEYVGHPRTAGTRGKVLSKARELGVPLMFTIAQMSYWPAKHLGDTGLESMKMRGRLQEGKVADITIFDPLTVKDNATYTMGEQGLPTSGIPYVIVSGVPVVNKGVFDLSVKPGKSIRFPVEAKGKFKPVTVESWSEQHVIRPISIDDGGLAKP
ncbi:amidohydrolase family protein [Shewanella psychrotolerans]|uniref:amidohydrolase family protein n=1 Tax=Shewanella psychrotolerans TaxID=2864206 RepID=UPI001C6587FC|nr:amidohydrolase family protein [Shewanella psychrotolerans]QYK01657.1 D-glutamate deacylase [Shewanella psychrotolerans]